MEIMSARSVELGADRRWKIGDRRWKYLSAGARSHELREVRSWKIAGRENEAENMEIKRCGAQPSSRGPAEWFTGRVRIDPLFEAKDPARALGASVTFEPGAR